MCDENNVLSFTIVELKAVPMVTLGFVSIGCVGFIASRFPSVGDASSEVVLFISVIF